MSNLERIYELQLEIQKEKLEILKKSRIENTLFRIADFLLFKTVPIINLFDVLNQIRERKKYEKRKR